MMEVYCFQEILNDLLLELTFNCFKSIELERLSCVHCGEMCHKYVNKPGLDIYGQKIDNHDANGELVECPVCRKSVAASRFAPHLEKCLGLGRNGRSKRSNSKIADEIFDPTVERASHSEASFAEDDIHEEVEIKTKSTSI